MASRWDITLQFFSGPLSTHPPSLTVGPEIRLGRRLHGHGIHLFSEHGIEDEHAVITVDPAGNASIAPVGAAPVRVAPDRLTDWRNHPPLREPVELAPGDVVHLGPIYRGVSFCFVRARPIDDAPQADTSRTSTTPQWRRPLGIAALAIVLALAAAHGLRFFNHKEGPASLVTDGAHYRSPLLQTPPKSDGSD